MSQEALTDNEESVREVSGTRALMQHGVMRRRLFVFLLLLLTLAVTSTAFAVTRNGGSGNDRMIGTSSGDRLNGHATGHGGYIFMLADSAFAFACNSRGTVTGPFSRSAVWT